MLSLVMDLGMWDRPVSDQDAAAWLRLFPLYEPASLTDPDLATEQTVRLMVRLVRHALTDPIVGRAWDQAWRNFSGITGGDEIACAWWYAKYLLKFVHHQKLFRDWMGLTDELQLLISPEALLKMRSPKGDCAVYTCLIAALLSYRGIPWQVVTVAVDPRMPGIFTHVYAQATDAAGRPVALDASHGKFPGWHVPDERVSKKKYGTNEAMKSPVRTLPCVA